VGGLIKAVLSPGGAPFTQARITAVAAHLVDQADLEFGFGCLPILGCLAGQRLHDLATGCCEDYRGPRVNCDLRQEPDQRTQVLHEM